MLPSDERPSDERRDESEVEEERAAEGALVAAARAAGPKLEAWMKAALRGGAGTLDRDGERALRGRLVLALAATPSRLTRALDRLADVSRSDGEPQASRPRARVGPPERGGRPHADLLSGLSHELRTPLNAIIGFAELLRDGKAGPLAPTHHEYLGDVLDSGRQLLALVTDLLDLARLEGGRTRIAPAPTHLEPLLAGCAQRVATLAADRGVRVTIERDDSLEVVDVDAARLAQLLDNLLVNGVKFARPGGAVTLRARAATRDRFAVEVEDDGAGVPARDLDRLFVEFPQIATRRPPSTGLGLSLCRAIAAAMGGAIGARSTPDGGSRFYAELPRSPGAVPAFAPAPRLSPREGAQVVLAVAASRDERAVLVRALVQAGLAVQPASSPAEVERLLSEERFAAIAVGPLPADESPVAWARRIRELPLGAEPPLALVLAAPASGGVTSIAVGSVLRRPLTRDALVRAIRRERHVAAGWPRVLAIEPDPIARDELSAMLAGAWCAPRVVASATAALEVARAEGAPELLVGELSFDAEETFALLDGARRLRGGDEVVLLPIEREERRTSGAGTTLRASGPPPSFGAAAAPAHLCDASADDLDRLARTIARLASREPSAPAPNPRREPSPPHRPRPTPSRER